MNKALLLTLCVGVIFLQACKKDNDSPAPASDNNNQTIVFEDGEISPTDGNGYFAAVYTINYFIGPANDVITESDMYVAFGAFYNEVPVTSYINGGNVILNSTDTLTIFNGAYMLTSSLDIFNGGNTWTITGNSATGVSAFTHTGRNTFPDFDLWDVKSNYLKSSGITITLPAGYQHTDTALFLVASYADQSKRVYKLVSPGTNTITMTAAELADIPAGEISIQLTAISIATTTITNNKKYYFFNEFQRTANAKLN